MQVGVNSKLLYAAVFFLLLTPIVLGSDTGALSAIPAWAPPLLALIFFAIFFLGKQRIISIGVYPVSPNEGAGAGNPVDSSPLSSSSNDASRCSPLGVVVPHARTRWPVLVGEVLRDRVL